MLMDPETARIYLPLLVEGTMRTIELSILTLIVGFLIALPVAWCRNARNAALRGFAFTFVFVFRGAPLLVLLFLVYYGTPELPVVRNTFLWGLFQQPFFCAVLALSLNSAGYLTEILAGAARGIPRGEIEAAEAAGLSRLQIARHVVFPNAARIGLRAYGNEVTFVIKGTSAASLVTIVDLMASANQIYYATFDPITPLVAAGAIYFAGVYAVLRLVDAAEIRLTPELSRRAKKKRTRTAVTETPASR